MPTHFTEIEVGAAANADTFNDPLTELDLALNAEAVARAAADDALNAELADIIADSGTSSTETVNARSAGNVGSAATTLTERLGWLEGAQNVYAAAYGFDDGATAAANTTAMNAATAAAAAFAAPAVVVLPAGKFNVNPFTVPTGIALRGARMPYYDLAATTLKGGTILYNTGGSGSGVVTLTDGAALLDLGIETTAARNAVSASGVDDCQIFNVATKGNGTQHGIAFAGGASRNSIRNFFAAEFDHGIAIKGSHNQGNGLSFINCATSAITLTSDDGFDVTGNVLTNIHSVNATVGSGGGFRVYTGGTADVYDNVVGNFYLQDPGAGIYCSANVSAGALCQYNRFQNGTIVRPQTNGVWMYASNTVAGNGADYNDFVGITVLDPVSIGFNNTYGGTHNSLHACRSRLGPGTDDLFGTWAKYDLGIGNPATMVVQLSKTAQSIANATWTDVSWEGEVFDPNNMHTGTAAEIGNPPLNGGIYRIRATLTFAANATGSRMARIMVSISGGAYTQIGPEQCVTPGSATADCTAGLEYIVQFFNSRQYRIQAQQTSGGALNLQLTCSLSVELVK